MILRQHSNQLLLLVAAICFLTGSLWSQSGDETTPDTARIVQSIEQHDKSQAKALKRYHALRHYEVEYRGLFKKINANMDVELDFDDNIGKSFKIVAESGSHTLCEKVLRRALDSEKDAAQDRGAHALTPANYKFKLLGSETLDGRPAYLLQVEPLSGSQFLYRGKIWVDAADGAVSKMEVEPAKNPSFWISQTVVHQTNTRVDGFWLPEHNHSETKVRLGGKALMTIEYGNYQILQSPSPRNSDENNSEKVSERLRASAQ